MEIIPMQSNFLIGFGNNVIPLLKDKNHSAEIPESDLSQCGLSMKRVSCKIFQEVKMAVIFHIEDESSVRLLYREVFEEQGYGVVQAETAEEALKTLKSFKPDLIILDLKMPGIGGRGFLEKFHRLKLKIPIIVSTAYPYYQGDPGLPNVDALVVKSGDLRELIDKVRELLGHVNDRAS